VKSSNHTHNPLCREIFNKQQRKERQMLWRQSK
jgi:predicted nucleic acid-binding Zn ribbon protein